LAIEQAAPAQEDPGTPEQTDEQLWEEIVEDGEEETEQAPPIAEPEPLQKDVQETLQENVQENVQEPDVEDDDDVEDDPEPQHDYQKRYKDLEKEFHKRNEESARMREELNEIRLKALEEKQAPEVEEKEAQEPDSLYTDEDRETMEEFSELTGTFRKMIQEEMARASGEEPKSNERLEKLENAYNQYTYERFLQNHENSMVDQVGDFYKDLDKDPDFQTFVLASPALTNMMTKSADPSDHASVMNLYLDTSDKGDQWRPDTAKAPKKASPAKAARRVAASGLSKNSAPVMERSPENMSDQELWDNVPEPKDDF